MPALASQPRKSALARKWSTNVGEYVTCVGAAEGRGVWVVGTQAGEIWVLDRETGAAVAQWLAHSGGVIALSVRADPPQIASGGRDGVVRIWGLDGAEAGAFRTQTQWVEHLAWAPIGAVLAVAAGREILLLNADGQVRAQVERRPSTVSGVSWSLGPGPLWSAELRGVRSWNSGTGAADKQFPCSGSMVSIAVSPDGSLVACGAQDTSVRVFDAEDGTGMTLQAAQLKPTVLRWDGSGRYLAHNGGNDAVLWDFAGVRPAACREGPMPLATLLQVHQGRVSALDFAAEAPLLASAASDGSVAVWDLSSGGKRLGVVFTDAPVSNLRWARGLLCVGLADGTVVTWSTQHSLRPKKPARTIPTS